MTGPIQHFCSSVLDARRYRVSAKLADREGFRGADFVDFKAHYNYLSPPT